MMPDLWGPPSAAEISAAENENARLSKRVKELEAQNTELLKKVEQLQEERDAAVDELRGHKCDTCEYREIDSWEEPCLFCINGNRWQWLVVQKEE